MVLSPCGSTEPLSVAEKLPMLVTGFVVTIGGPVAVSVVNVPSLPKTGAAAVVSYNPEMISVARTQAADVSADSPDSVPILSLHRRGVPVAGR